MWKSLEREYAMMCSVTFMCCEYCWGYALPCVPLSNGGVFVSLLCQTNFFELVRWMMTLWLFYVIVGSLPIIFLWWLVCEKFATSILVTRLIGRSGFGDTVGCVKAASIDYTQEITSLGVCLMWNNAVVCGGKVRLKYFCEGLVWYVEIPWEGVRNDVFCYFYVLWVLLGVRYNRSIVSC